MDTTKQRDDASINGDGRVAGGSYRRVAINGSGSIGGDLDCEELRINGSGSIGGSLTAPVVVINGQGTIEGAVSGNDFAVHGHGQVRGGLGATQLRVLGSLSLDGGVVSRDIDLKGELRSGGDVKAEAFTGEGRFVVAGALEARRLDLAPHGLSSARTITGDRIVLREPIGFATLITMFADRRVTCDSVEGDDVSLIYTTAKVVRGARVVLGAGCQVDLVEYSESLSRLAGAQVREERKVEAV